MYVTFGRERSYSTVRIVRLCPRSAKPSIRTLFHNLWLGDGTGNRNKMFALSTIPIDNTKSCTSKKQHVLNAIWKLTGVLCSASHFRSLTIYQMLSGRLSGCLCDVVPLGVLRCMITERYDMNWKLQTDKIINHDILLSLSSPSAGLSTAIAPQSGIGFNQCISADGMSCLHGGLYMYRLHNNFCSLKRGMKKETSIMQRDWLKALGCL